MGSSESSSGPSSNQSWLAGQQERGHHAAEENRELQVCFLQCGFCEKTRLRRQAGERSTLRLPQHYFGAGGSHRLSFSAVGKLSGTFCVTRPVAAHSVPRFKVVTKPTSFIDTTS